MTQSNPFPPIITALAARSIPSRVAIGGTLSVAGGLVIVVADKRGYSAFSGDNFQDSATFQPDAHEDVAQYVDWVLWEECGWRPAAARVSAIPLSPWLLGIIVSVLLAALPLALV